MKLFSLALAFVTSAVALTINTPTGPVNECENVLLTWEGATGPTQIFIFPQGVTSGPPLETLPAVQGGNSFAWLVDVPVGSYTLALKDLSTGESVFSGAAQVTPNPNGDTSCEGKNGSSPPGGSGGLTLNTPVNGLNECENTLLTWEGSTGPTQISVFPAGVTSGEPVTSLPIVQSGNSVFGLVDVSPGSYTLALKDLTTGETVFSGAVNVTPNPSGDTSCEGQNPPGPLTINTPTGRVKECKTTLLTWSGTVGQSQISVFRAGVTSGPAIETLPVQSGTSFRWRVDVLPGAYTLGLKDLTTGQSVFSGAFTVSPNPGGHCSSASALPRSATFSSAIRHKEKNTRK